MTIANLRLGLNDAIGQGFSMRARPKPRTARGPLRDAKDSNVNRGNSTALKQLHLAIAPIYEACALICSPDVAFPTFAEGILIAMAAKGRAPA